MRETSKRDQADSVDGADDVDQKEVTEGKYGREST